jgi:hypothetical protein
MQLNRSAIIGVSIAAAVGVVISVLVATGSLGILTETKKALIIDGLNEDLPNQEFIDESTRILEAMGYKVDLVQDATIDLYTKLPKMGYDLLILRTHGAEELTYLRSKTDGSLKLVGASSSLFTTEAYTEDRYMQEQEQNYIKGSTAVYNGKPYFAATSFFVKDKMQGNFDDTIIILMGCFGFPTMDLEESYTISVPNGLLNRGAKAVVGWDGLVSLPKTETATIHLLRNMQTGMSFEDAFNDTKEEVGHDKTYDSRFEMLASSSLATQAFFPNPS